MARRDRTGQIRIEDQRGASVWAQHVETACLSACLHAGVQGVQEDRLHLRLLRDYLDWKLAPGDLIYCRLGYFDVQQVDGRDIECVAAFAQPKPDLSEGRPA